MLLNFVPLLLFNQWSLIVVVLSVVRLVVKSLLALVRGIKPGDLRRVKRLVP